MKKMKNFKKFLAISLAVMLVATALPFSALMASAEVPATLSLDTVETYLAALGEEETVDSSVATWLKEYFVNIDSANNIGTLSYDAAALADYPNVKAYFAGGLLTDESAAFSYGNAEKVMLPQSVLPTGLSQKVVTAIDYSAPGVNVNLWSLIPAIPGFTVGDYTLADSEDPAIFKFVNQSNKTMLEADGATVHAEKVGIRPLWYSNYTKDNNANRNTKNIYAGSTAGNGQIQPAFNLNNWVEFSTNVYKYVGGDTVVISADYTYSDFSASDDAAKISDTDNVSAMKLTATYKFWVEDDATANYVLDVNEKLLCNITFSTYYRYDNETSDGTPYFSLVKSNFGLFDYISIESELPAAPAEDVFREFYAANKDNFTAATLAEAAELYNACSDAAKAEADIVAAYADIKVQIKNLYVKDGKVEYKGDNADLLALALNNENDRLSVTESDVATTVGQKVKIAFDYSVANNGKVISFDVLPTLTAITDTENNLSISQKASGKFFELVAQSNKTFTVGGNSVTGQSVYYPMFSDPGNQAATSLRYKGGFAGGAGYSNAAFNDTIYKESSTAGTWVYKTGNNIVFDFEYFVEDFTASDATLKNLDTTVKAKSLRFSYLRIWTEEDGNNELNEGDQIICNADWAGSSVEYRMNYRYDSAVKELLPALSIPAATAEFVNYISVEETTEEAEFGAFIASTVSERSVFSSLLPILKEYAELDAKGVISNEEIKENITEHAERLGMMPLNLGATVRTDADNQNLAFFGKAPYVNTGDGKLARITKIGVVMKPYNLMLQDGDKELTKETEGAVYKEVTSDEADINGKEFRFTLSGTDVANSDRWGKWIVSRIYAEYTMADGSTFILYSLDTNDNNPADATDDFVYGTAVRCVNGVLKTIAGALYGKYTDNSEENAELKGKLEAVTGAAYKDVDNATQDKYVGLNLTDAYALANAENGKLPDAKEMLYFLLAFKNAVALIA